MGYRLPFIQLHVDDWLQDGVSACSLAAQGLWLRMMFQMHVSDRYGYLILNGIPIPLAAIARRAGVDLDEFGVLFAELERAGVPSRSSEGLIYSRRMVRDAEKRAKDAEKKAKQRRLNVANVPTHVPPDVPDKSIRDSEIQRRSASVAGGNAANPEEPPIQADFPALAKSWLIEHYPNTAAVNWSVANCKHVVTMASMMARYGQHEACAAVLESIESDKSEPVSYANAVLQKKHNHAALKKTGRKSLESKVYNAG